MIIAVLSLCVTWCSCQILNAVDNPECFFHHEQYYCLEPGPDYPRDQIQSFIADNAALSRRMYGVNDPQVVKKVSTEAITSEPKNPIAMGFPNELVDSSIVNLKKEASRIFTHERDKQPEIPEASTPKYQPPRRAGTTFDPFGGYLPPMPQPAPAHPTSLSLLPPFSPLDNINVGNRHGSAHRRFRRNTDHRYYNHHHHEYSPYDQQNETVEEKDLEDSCKSSTHALTPYWMSNVLGQIRVIVNSQQFPQVVYTERCVEGATSGHCKDGCVCRQKFKLHRMLAYDPENDCGGIFMDNFMFPSACVCRCPRLEN